MAIITAFSSKEWGDFDKNHHCQALKQTSLTYIKPEFFS
jgi:hypothetical protein